MKSPILVLNKYECKNQREQRRGALHLINSLLFYILKKCCRIERQSIFDKIPQIKNKIISKLFSKNSTPII